jgi:hypothetical protein
MKILFILLTLPIYIFSQPKNANTAVFPALTQDTLIYKLVEAGYEIKSTVGLVSTEYKVMDETLQVRLIIRKKDSLMYMTGEYIDATIAAAFNLKDNPPQKACNCGTLGSLSKPPFKELMRVAKILSSNAKFEKL